MDCYVYVNNLRTISILSILATIALVTSSVSTVMAQENMTMTIEDGGENMTYGAMTEGSTTMMNDNNVTSISNSTTN